MGKLDVFMSYSPCDLGAALSCRQRTLKSLFCGNVEGVSFLFTTANASETFLCVKPLII